MSRFTLLAIAGAAFQSAPRRYQPPLPFAVHIAHPPPRWAPPAVAPRGRRARRSADAPVSLRCLMPIVPLQSLVLPMTTILLDSFLQQRRQFIRFVRSLLLLLFAIVPFDLTTNTSPTMSQSQTAPLRSPPLPPAAARLETAPLPAVLPVVVCKKKTNQTHYHTPTDNPYVVNDSDVDDCGSGELVGID